MGERRLLADPSVVSSSSSYASSSFVLLCVWASCSVVVVVVAGIAGIVTVCFDHHAKLFLAGFESTKAQCDSDGITVYGSTNASRTISIFACS
jgi:hypothetical protein